MDYLTHITFEGQRIDQIAFEYYGDITQSTLILDANPLLPIKRNYPSGVIIRIPIIQKPVTNADLPPWLRG